MKNSVFISVELGISSKVWKVTGAPQRLTSSPTLEVDPAGFPLDPRFFVGRDTILFSMGERTGNIWMAEWKERG